MASTKLKVYPSGFLGSATVATTEPLDIGSIKQRLFDSSPLGNIAGHTANLEITSLWHDVVAGDPSYKSFEFRERILRVALAAFGVPTLRGWVVAQAQSPMHTEYQQKWIEETFRFVFEGTPREYTYNIWHPLVVCGHGDRSYLNNHAVTAKVGVGAPYEHLSIPGFISRWAAQPRGIDDMIESLNLLFGKR